MSPFWHPLSTLLLCDPPVLATETLLRMLLGSGPVRIVYAGDRMWPALEHGERLTVEPLESRGLAPGTLLVVPRDGIPDVLRLRRVEGTRLRLSADADAEIDHSCDAASALGRVDRPRRSGRFARARRLFLDLREAWSARADPAPDLSRTVRDKYDSQAPFYATSPGRSLEPDLRARLLDALPPAAEVLVVGCGAGRECFALAEEGFGVTGLDFAPAMISQARAEASRRGAAVRFIVGDLRTHAFPPSSFDGILFTYDVYSFVPGSHARIDMMRRLQPWLRCGGVCFVSARRVRSAAERAVLTLQFLASRRAGAEWGDSHTRWIAGDGELHRSFVRYLTPNELRLELEQAAFHVGEWRGGHGLLRSAEIAPAAKMR